MKHSRFFCNSAQVFILKTVVEHTKISFALSLSKGGLNFGMLTKWVNAWKPLMLRQAQHERLRRASTAAFRFMLVILTACPLTAWSDNTWSYHQESDSLTNQTYSYAQSPLPRPGLYDDMMLEIVCKGNKLQAVIDADDLIASQGSRFNLDYQIDKKDPVTVAMKTFPDSKRKGYTEEFAKRIADDLLTGQTLFIRVHTMIRTVLSSSMPLDNAAEPVKHVLADCGLTASNNLTGQPAYTLAEFEQDLSKLTTEQQQQVLTNIKKIMLEIR